jgi:hypothetical protein
MARVYNRKEGSIPYVASTQQTLELSRNYHVQRYLLTLEVNVENGTNGGVYYNDNLFNLISMLTLVANGSLNVKQIPGEKLYYNYLLDKGLKPYTVFNSTAGTKTLKQSVFIDLCIPNELRPQDTILNTKVFDTLNLNVVWGDVNSIASGNVTINSARLYVSSEQLIGYQRQPGERINYYKEVARRENITSSNNNYLVKLDVNQFYAGFLLRAKNANLLSNDVIKNIRIKSGTTIFMDLGADEIQRLNENDIKIVNQDSNKGLYYLDFTPRGKLSDMLNTVQNANGFNTLELELDLVSGTNTTIDIYSEFIEITNQTEVKA